MVLGLSIILQLPRVMSPSLGSGEFGGRIQGGKYWLRGDGMNFPKLLPKEVESPKDSSPMD